MDIDARLAAIERLQAEILNLLDQKKTSPTATMSLKEAATYVGYSANHFRRLAVEQRIIPFSRPSGQQKGKLLFRQADLDQFIEKSSSAERTGLRPGRKRKSLEFRNW